MTCNVILELILEADPDQLAGRGTSAVAAHVRKCDRCAIVARRILAQSELLAVAVREDAPVDLAAFAARTRFPRRALIGGSIIAAAASVLFTLGVQRVPQPSANGRPPVAPRVAVLAVPTVRQLPASGSVRTDARARRTEVSVARVEPHRFAPAHPVVTEPLTVAPVPETVALDAGVVTVDPPPGTRASVMRGRNPSITVVWLY